MDAYCIPPGDARSVMLAGIGVVFKISGAETGGAFTVVEHPIQPGVLVPPHRHTREDEFSYVLEGEIGVRIGDQIFQAGPGSYVYKPRNIPHTFWNSGPKPARLIEFITPSGMENYFEELSALIHSGGPFDHDKFLELISRYGHTEDGMQWVPELVAKYGVKFPG